MEDLIGIAIIPATAGVPVVNDPRENSVSVLNSRGDFGGELGVSSSKPGTGSGLLPATMVIVP